jgi:hypothetical protein
MYFTVALAYWYQATLAPPAAGWSDPEPQRSFLLSETSIGAGRTLVSLKSFSNCASTKLR